MGEAATTVETVTADTSVFLETGAGLEAEGPAVETPLEGTPVEEKPVDGWVVLGCVDRVVGGGWTTVIGVKVGVGKVTGPDTLGGSTTPGAVV